MNDTVKKYIVKWGDTLSEIAIENKTTVDKLMDLNPSIKDPDIIVAGQEIVTSGTAAPVQTNYTSRPKIELFGLQSGTDRTIYATWTWTKDNTENYEVMWKYATGDGIGFIGNESTTKHKQSLYTAPENATHISFKVRPISKTYKSGNKDVNYWTAQWSTESKYYFKDSPPSTPPVPTVEIEDYTLTATLENLDVNGTHIEFQVVKDNETVFKTGKAKIVTTVASYSCTVDAGSEYKVRCRAVRDDFKSEWTEYSGNSSTSPAAPKEILELRALSSTSIYLDWSKVSTAESYEIEYASNKSRFDSSNETQSLTVESVISHAEVTGLESGLEWFFRVRAVNTQGESPWTAIKSVKIGTAPAAPTTWSSTTTATTGEEVNLYWVHNTEDGSSQTFAQLELIIGGNKTTHTIENTASEEEKDKTSVYSIKTSGYTEGTKIRWRVRTRGILETYSDWSMQRTVDIYAPPTLSLTMRKADASLIEVLDSFPFYIQAIGGPNAQKVIGYHVAIISNEIYETLDNMGQQITVNKGEEVYSEYFDRTRLLNLKLSAGDLTLENNIRYTIKASVTMNYGLTAEESYDFSVAWTGEEYWPNAEIGYDPATYSTFIRPFCTDENGASVRGVKLDVYRREFNGKFTEIGRGLKNESNTFVTDPHPALDFARYRVVATDPDTGKVSYYDVPGFPIQEKAIIIQWDEEWTEFDTTIDEVPEQPAWTGSLLRLPYNIDISDSYASDVSLVEYIGREHPVSYYGTQLGEASNWSTEIDKQDNDTIYALRRLAAWMGDCYVREPSGTGYWARVVPSFSRTHLELTIPISLEVTRVEGGV